MPAVNPDGLAAFRRTNGNLVDLNRDWLKCTQPATCAIRTLLAKLQPEVFVDLHDLRMDEDRTYAVLEAANLPNPASERREQTAVASLAALLTGVVNLRVIKDGLDADYALAHRAAAQYLPYCSCSLLYESRAKKADHLHFLEALFDVVTRVDMRAWTSVERASLANPPPKARPEYPKASQSQGARTLELVLFFGLLGFTRIWLLWGSQGPPLLAQLAKRRSNLW